MTGLWVLLATLGAAGIAGFVLRARDGRFRTGRATVTATPGTSTSPTPIPTTPPAGTPAAAPDLRGELAQLGETPGDRATLVQFSSAFCQPCRATRRILGEVAAAVPGVRHVEIDAEAHLDLVRRLAVRRTPTVLVLDAAGREVRRASGAPPHRDAVLAAIGSAVDNADHDR